MHYFSAFLFLSIGLPSIAHPSGNVFDKRTVTPDNTCGNAGAGQNKGYTCDPSNSYGGPCCSASGYCGKATDYCGTGCQSAFGTCGLSSESPGTTPASTTAASKPSSTPSQGSPTQQGGVYKIDGVGSFTKQQTFDFSGASDLPTGLDISTDSIGQGDGTFSQIHSKDNVQVNGGSLQLKVPGGQNASPLKVAEVTTTEKTIKYGSVRTTMQISSVKGTCHGAFFYEADNEETDIEIITGGLDQGMWGSNQNLVLGGKSTAGQKPLPNDATSAFHEYRVDWLADKTAFYIDGAMQFEHTENVPNKAGQWIWNNWSNGNPQWSMGPPAQDNVMKIKKIEMYYNTTSS